MALKSNVKLRHKKDYTHETLTAGYYFYGESIKFNALIRFLEDLH